MYMVPKNTEGMLKKEDTVLILIVIHNRAKGKAGNEEAARKVAPVEGDP